MKTPFFVHTQDAPLEGKNAQFGTINFSPQISNFHRNFKQALTLFCWVSYEEFLMLEISYITCFMSI